MADQLERQAEEIVSVDRILRVTKRCMRIKIYYEIMIYASDGQGY